MPHDAVFYQDKYRDFKTSMMHEEHLVPFSTAWLSSSSNGMVINLPKNCTDQVNIGIVKMSNSTTKAQERETARIYARSRWPECQGKTMDYTLNSGLEKVSELYYKIGCHDRTPILWKLAQYSLDTGSRTSSILRRESFVTTRNVVPIRTFPLALWELYRRKLWA
jgi:hypothetical protein